MAAAGSGERLGAGGPKAFVEAAGQPLLAWSLAAFAASEETGAVVIAAPPGEEERAARIAAEAGLADVLVVAGGETRFDSVAEAMMPVTSELVAIHDAARPLVTPELIDALAALLRAHPEVDAAIAAAPITDTVKRAAREQASGVTVAVDRTESRERLWGAQTPQLFRTARLREAFAVHDGSGVTDEAMLIEAAGGAVLMQVPATHNLKVTTAAELELAEALLG
ncbi:MAG: 2-C-methyl-D-erythritol 4-phosphate cytidylyltransferase [Solirubrobacterales bacterium]